MKLELLKTPDLIAVKAGLTKITPEGPVEGYAIGRMVYQIDAELLKREQDDRRRRQ